MNLRNITPEEFDVWMEMSSEIQAGDRAFANNTTIDVERASLERTKKGLLARGMNSQGHYFFVLDGEMQKNIGFIWFCELPGIKENEIFLMDIIVDPAMRHKGYGKKLLSLGQDRMRKKGYRKIVLSVMERNNAKYLYESFGYKTFQKTKYYKKMFLEISQ